MLYNFQSYPEEMDWPPNRTRPQCPSSRGQTVLWPVLSWFSPLSPLYHVIKSRELLTFSLPSQSCTFGSYSPYIQWLFRNMMCPWGFCIQTWNKAGMEKGKGKKSSYFMYLAFAMGLQILCIHSLLIWIPFLFCEIIHIL